MLVAEYAIASAAPPFLAFVFAIPLTGIVLSLPSPTSQYSRLIIHCFQGTGAHGYVASLKGSSQTEMGIMHAMHAASRWAGNSAP